ncbi:MAG TPA: hypothetical protein DCM87_15460 [Planctomycetes bacterium]|nr:hypothetical protein [Planctomycetota bacterium]
MQAGKIADIERVEHAFLLGCPGQLVGVGGAKVTGFRRRHDVDGSGAQGDDDGALGGVFVDVQAYFAH